MSQTQSFLSAFHEVENDLRVRAGKDRDEDSLLGVLRHLGRHPVIRRYGLEIRRLAELRNLLVHHSGPAIAEPTQVALNTLEKIHQLLTRPPSVLDISSKPVATCTDDTPIHDVLKHMESHNYDQMPVYSEHTLIGVFSNESARRWITAKSDPDGFILEDRMIKDLIGYLDIPSADDFLPRTAEAFVIEKHFAARANARRITALFVTEHGRMEECLMGIITPHDLPKIQKFLGSNHLWRAEQK